MQQQQRIKQDLDEFISLIFKGESYTPQKHMEIYSKCVSYCQTSPGNALELYKLIENKCKFKLKQLLTEIKKINSIPDMIDFLIHNHENYFECCQKFSRVFTYLDRFFVNNQKSVNGEFKDPLHKHCISLFWDHFFKAQAEKIVESTMILIAQERADKDMTSVNRERIKGIMSVFLFFSNSDMVTDAIIKANIYDEYYQEQYKRESELYFKNLNEVFSNYGVTDFLQKTIEITELERERSQYYIASNVQKEFWEFLQKKFIAEQCNFIVDKMGSLLRKREKEDLMKCFIVLRDGNKINESKTTFEKFVREVGEYHMQRVMQMKTMPDVIKQVVAYYNEITDLINECFQNHSTYILVFGGVFREIINGSTVVLGVDIGTIIPEYLAKYTDVVTKQSVGGDELNKQLDIIFNIYEYIDNKDVFETYYIKGIAKRMLLRGNTEDLMLENNVFGKHKIKFSSAFSYKISKMMSDLQTSQILSDQFMEKISLPYPYHVNVLQTSVWPFEQHQIMFQLPTEMQEQQTIFEKWYVRNHPRRKLEWLHQYTRGKMRTTYLPKAYTIFGNAYQLSVLSLFNDNAVMTVTQIFEIIHLTMDIVKSIVNSLVQAKILKIKDENVSVNTGFKSSKPKISLPIPKSIVVEESKEDVDKEITIERIGVIEACVVKLMKRNKHMNHNELLQSVVTTLSSKFRPSIPLIKKAIESLIEREYITRSESKRDEYIYLE